MLPLCLALALGWPGTGFGQVAGSGSLTGNGLLEVKGCGRDQLRGIAMTFTVRTDGTWAVVIPDPEGDVQLGGTNTLAGKNGRRLALQFDPDSTAAFLQGLAADISELCARPITLDSVKQKTFVLTLNKKRTRAKLVIAYRFEGGAGAGGKARWKVTAKGPWTAS